MKDQSFRLSLLAYLAILIAWLTSVWLLVFLFGNSPEQPKLNENWFPLLLIIAALVSPSLFLTWSFIVEMTTSFSRDGISRLTLLGKKHISWREIKTIQVRIFFIDIKLASGAHQIPLLMYRDPVGLVNYIREKYDKFNQA